MKGARLIGWGMVAASAVVLGGAVLGGEASVADIVKDMLDTMEKMTGSLGTITDAATAKAAVPDLRKAAQHWKVLRHKAEKAKPPSREESDKLKKEFHEKLEATHKKLFGEIARVKKVPGSAVALNEIKLIVKKAK